MRFSEEHAKFSFDYSVPTASFRMRIARTWGNKNLSGFPGYHLTDSRSPAKWRKRVNRYWEGNSEEEDTHGTDCST